jgi:hypothetical protein
MDGDYLPPTLYLNPTSLDDLLVRLTWKATP